MAAPLLYGAVEAGGTKFVCALGDGSGEIRAEARLPTTKPAETIGRAIEFFQAEAGRHGKIAALGIGSFGPVDLDPASPTWGFITSTPKEGWAGTELAGALGRALGVPIAFTTDVGAAAIGEGRRGAAQGLEDFAYVTVGTGIGGAAVSGGRLVRGLLHPEMGHLRPPRHKDDAFAGVCRFHGDCLEGLASGPALAARWGKPAEELPADHEAWEIEAHYLAHLAATLTLVLSPRRILFGGGVMAQPSLLPRVREQLTRLLGGYLDPPWLQPPALGPRAGVLGALALAAELQAGGETTAVAIR